MFGTRRDQPEPTPEPQPELEPTAEPAPSAAMPVRPISMFGSKAEKLARFGPPLDQRTMPPRLVSLGRQVHKDPGATNQRGKIWEFEAFADLNDARAKWIRWPGEKEPHRADDVTYASDPPPEPLGTIPRRLGPSGHHPAGQDDKVIPAPDITPEEMALARAMFARGDGPSDPPPTPAFDPVPW